LKLFKDLTTTAGSGSEGIYNSDGSLQHKKLKALTRTYVQRAQGTILKQKFNAENGEYYAQIEINDSIQEFTEIYMNMEYWYPHGANVTFSADGSSFNMTSRIHNFVTVDIRKVIFAHGWIDINVIPLKKQEDEPI